MFNYAGRFRRSKIDNALIERFEKVTGKPVHHWLRRGVFFSLHYLDTILHAHEQGKPFYIYTTRGISPDAFHLGHLIQFKFAK